MALVRVKTKKKAVPQEVPQEVPEGILDRCRDCGVEIIRKARTRPKLCKACEKKKSKSVEDKCMDCNQIITTGNVRKARRCADCKEKLRKLKKEAKKQRTEDESNEEAKYQAVHLNDVMSQRVYATNNRIRFLQETRQLALMFCRNGYGIPACFREHGLYCEWSELLFPPRSLVPKCNTECFTSPEEIVEHILFIRSQLLAVRQESDGDKEVSGKDDDVDDDSNGDDEGDRSFILVPHHVELRIDPNVPSTRSCKIEVEIVDEEMESTDSEDCQNL